MRRPLLGTAWKVLVLGGWLLGSAVLTAAAPEQGRLVHVADTRQLAGFNLYVANLYNTNRLLFTLLSVGLTAMLGFVLGVVMDAVVGAIGLDLRKREFKE